MARVSIIGSGKAARFMSTWIRQSGHSIDAVYSRNAGQGLSIAHASGAGFYPLSESSFEINSDIVILAVSDSVIDTIASRIEGSAMKVHLSGAAPLSKLMSETNAAVMWPLISLNESTQIGRSIPLLIEAADERSNAVIREFASSLSDQVRESGFDERQKLHLAAVFAGNFSNYLFHIAWKICRERAVDASLLLPLIQSVANNLQSGDPLENQTGPAIRGDRKTLEHHERLLLEMDMMAELGIYRSLSALIESLRKK